MKLFCITLLLLPLFCFSQKEETFFDKEDIKIKGILKEVIPNMDPIYLCDVMFFYKNKKIKQIKNLKIYPKAYYEDVNFDGIKDIRISAGASHNAYNPYCHYYIFNSRTKKFEYRKEFTEIVRPVYNKIKKEITSIKFGGCWSSQTVAKFRIVNNRLLKISQIKVIIEKSGRERKFEEHYNYIKKRLIKYTFEGSIEGSFTEVKEVFKLKKDSKTLIKKDYTEQYSSVKGGLGYHTEHWRFINSKLKLINERNKLMNFKVNYKFIDYKEENIY